MKLAYVVGIIMLLALVPHVNATDYNIKMKKTYTFTGNPTIRDLVYYQNFLFISNRGDIENLMILKEVDDSFELVGSLTTETKYGTITILDQYIVAFNHGEAALFSWSDRGSIIYIDTYTSEDPIFDGKIVKIDGEYHFIFTTGVQEPTIKVYYLSFVGDLLVSDTSLTSVSLDAKPSSTIGQAAIDVYDGSIFLAFRDIIIEGSDGSTHQYHSKDHNNVDSQHDIVYNGEYIYYLTEFNNYWGTTDQYQLFYFNYDETSADSISTDDMMSYSGVDTFREMIVMNDLIIVAQEANGVAILQHNHDTNEISMIRTFDANDMVLAIEAFDGGFVYSDGSELVVVSVQKILPSSSDAKLSSPFNYFIIAGSMLLIPYILKKRHQ